MIRSYLLLPLLFVLQLSLQAKKVAIVIGVGDYPEQSGLNDLAADHDTRQLVTLLKAADYEVQLLNCLQGELPTSANILAAIGLQRDTLTGAVSFAKLPEYLQNLSPEDELFFHFGGHGVTNQESADCIVPHDALFDRIGCLTEKRLISIDWIKRALTRTGAGVIVSIDACRQDIVVTRQIDIVERMFSPVFTRSAVVTENPVTDVQTELPGARSVTIKSAHPGQFAHEIAAARAGVYTHFLIQLFSRDEEQEIADNGPSDGTITVGEALEYLRSETNKYVAALPGPAKISEQTPYISWEGLEADQVFMPVNTKKLSDPDMVFQARMFQGQYPTEVFGRPVLVDPAVEYPRFFRLDPGELRSLLQELSRPNDPIPLAEFEFDHRFLVLPFTLADQNAYYQGLTPFDFYFPKELLATIIQNGRHRISISNLPYPDFRNARISGSCTYKLEQTNDPVMLRFKGRERSFKTWKITQVVNAADAHLCAPLTVKVQRTYWVLQNVYDPVIIRSEGYRSHFIRQEEIPARLKGICWGADSGVIYDQYQLDQVFIQK